MERGKGNTQSSNGRCSNGGGDVVVAGGDVGGEGSQSVVWRLTAPLDLVPHGFRDLVQGHMARALVHHLCTCHFFG